MPVVSKPPSCRICRPMRSASRSASRLKFNWRCIARPLPAHQHADRRVAGRARRQRRQQHRGQRNQRILLLAADHARDVALRHVADLVRQHRGQLRLGLRRQDQRRMHADETARQCEGVDARVAHREKGEIESRLAAHIRPRRHQRGAEVVQVFQDWRVVQVIRIAPDVVHDFLAQLALHQRRQFAAGGVAQGRQAIGGENRVDRSGAGGDAGGAQDGHRPARSGRRQAPGGRRRGVE